MSLLVPSSATRGGVSATESDLKLPSKQAPPVSSRPWHWAALLVLLNLLLFADALFTDRTFFFRDVSFFHYPLKRLVTEAYSHGEWPLWNPYIQLGQPLFANPNAMAFYPSQVLFQFLPFELAFELHFVLHCMLAGVVTFYLARELGLSSFSAFVAGAIYNFSGVTLSFVNLFNILPVVAFLPALTLVSVKILQGATLLRLLTASLLFGVFFLLLEPLSSLAIALFLLLFLGAYFLFSGRATLRAFQVVGCGLLVIISGWLFASIQILPTLELIQHSGRRGGLSFETVSAWSLHPINLLQVVFPRVFGDFFRLSQNGSWASMFFENREPYLLSCYLGIFSLAMALYGLCLSSRRWLTCTLALVALLALLLASGKFGPAYRFLFEFCPLFRYGRYPVKYLLIFNFSLSLLAGYGIERILELRSRGGRSGVLRRSLTAGVFGTLAILLTSLLLWNANRPSMAKGSGSSSYEFSYQGQELQMSRSTVAPALQSIQMQAGALLLFLGLCWIPNVRNSIVKLTGAVLILFDFGIHNFWINPLIRSELYDPAPAALYLQEQVRKEGPFRVFGLATDGDKEALTLGETNSIAWSFLFRKLTLAQFLSAKDHVSYAVFQPVDRLETLPSQRIHAELTATQSTGEKLKFLAGLNVGYVLSMYEIESPLVRLDTTFPVNSPQPFRLYRLLNHLPRAFLTDLQGPADGRLGFRDQLSVVGNEAELKALSVSQVQIKEYSPHRVQMEAESDRRRLLVLLDSYYPGWQAYVDGDPVPVAAANFVYRAIEFPEGHHRVDFRYEPKSFKYGAGISVCTGLCWGAAWLVNLLRRRQPAASSHSHA
jgi:Bacterial membrane protein YfhO